MSDMLEQAIIDAEALREAATKNAETLILEKYSDQIKESIETLLEQEEGDAELGADLGLDADLGLETQLDASPSTGNPAADAISSVMEHIPFAATADDNEQVEIPLDKLLEEVALMNESFSLEEEFDLDEELDTELDEALEDQALDEALEEDMDEDLYEELEEYMDEDLYEELGLDSEIVEEALEVDIKPVKRGWAAISEGEI